mgnify:CR=1 FL=1
MKKTLLILITLLTATFGYSQFTDSNFITYTVTSSSLNTVEITEYDATQGGTNVIIPETVTNAGTTYTVTSIGDGAFISKGLTNVSISNTVTSIGNLAFRINQLTNVTIPDNVISIGTGAFVGNPNISSVVFGNSLTTIGISSFGGCSLTHIVIPDNVTSIGNTAFANNQLISVTLGSSVSSIGTGTFSGNTATLNSVISKAVTPPTITTGGSGDTFNPGMPGGDRSGIDLIIPNNTSTAYNTALWTDFKSIVEGKIWTGTSIDWLTLNNWSPNSIPISTDFFIKSAIACSSVVNGIIIFSGLSSFSSSQRMI